MFFSLTKIKNLLKSEQILRMNKFGIISFILTLSLMLCGLFVSTSVIASMTDGTVSGYAWSENIGWINFGVTGGNVHITDSVLSGYAWNENKGWIKLDVATSGVKNNAEGILSGYAWGEGVGWINFSGVTIDSSGRFTGTATGDNTGQINFDCDNCGVQTDWRPQSQRGGGSTTNNNIGGGGSSLPQEAYDKPTGPFLLLINNGYGYTNNRNVVLSLSSGANTAKMAISDSSDFAGVGQEDYKTSKNWVLPIGDGPKIVYVKFYTKYGQQSDVIQSSIVLDTKAPSIEATSIKKEYNVAEDVIIGGNTTEPNVNVIILMAGRYGSFSSDGSGQWLVTFGKMPSGSYHIQLTPKDLAGNIGTPVYYDFSVSESAPLPTITQPSILEKIKNGLEFLVPKISEPEKLEPVEIITVPESTPNAFKSVWNVLPMNALSKFVLAPLPTDVAVLVNKFPELKKTFGEVGISKATDVQKLESANLTLPGLSQTIGIEGVEISPGKFTPPKGIPIAKLSATAKSKIPTDIVFAQVGGGLVDLNMGLSLNDNGQIEQRVSTIKAKPMQLIVRVDKPAREVIGYIVFKSKNPAEEQSASLSSALPNLVKAILEVAPSVEAAMVIKNSENGDLNAASPEKELVLSHFEYTNTGNGVYAATVQAPAVDGEYEVVTVINYEDLSLPSKEIRLITVVDPDGYIYEKNGDKETRIGGAIISLYWLNPETKQYELWPAKEYQQENPQTTDVRGTYSFLVPEGYYYLTVDAPGYSSYDGKPFEVKEGSGVHTNIEMKNKYWWLNIIDWKILLIVIVLLLLLYNFYRDKIRDSVILKNPR